MSKIPPFPLINSQTTLPQKWEGQHITLTIQPHQGFYLVILKCLEQTSLLFAYDIPQLNQLLPRIRDKLNQSFQPETMKQLKYYV